MKIQITASVIMLIIQGCNNHPDIRIPVNESSPATIVSIDEVRNTNFQSTPFAEILEFPLIKDTGDFILSLKKNCNIETDYNPANLENQAITIYKKIKIFGTVPEYILLEYDYQDGSMASFPWKYQFIFTKKGHLVKILSALKLDFVEIFPKENPFLMTTVSTAKGNGGYEFYRFSSDTLENIFPGFKDYFPRLYDAHQDDHLNKPYGLILKIKDINKDGFNDITFKGKIIHGISEGKNEAIPVKYVFLYIKHTGHFIEREDYSKKYIYLDK